MKEVKCATKAFIIDSGKLLVLKCKLGNMEYWDMPGGKMEFGLTLEENLKKEVMEEVGIEVEIKKMVGISQFMGHDGDQVVCINYLCEPRSKDLDLSRNPDNDELNNIVEALWMRPEEFYAQLPDSRRNNLKEFVKGHFIENQP
jgi:8-oxo-dGTP diphosphatase